MLIVLLIACDGVFGNFKHTHLPINVMGICVLNDAIKVQLVLF